MENKKLKEKIEYTKNVDYFYPNLTMKKEKIPNGKYALMRYNYLRKYKNYELTLLIINEKLNEHLVQVQQQAKKRIDSLINQMLEKEPIDENLKNTNPLKWTGLMNNYKLIAEEIVTSELIYV